MYCPFLLSCLFEFVDCGVRDPAWFKLQEAPGNLLQHWTVKTELGSSNLVECGVKVKLFGGHHRATIFPKDTSCFSCLVKYFLKGESMFHTNSVWNSKACTGSSVAACVFSSLLPFCAVSSLIQTLSEEIKLKSYHMQYRFLSWPVLLGFPKLNFQGNNMIWVGEQLLCPIVIKWYHALFQLGQENSLVYYARKGPIVWPWYVAENECFSSFRR